MSMFDIQPKPCSFTGQQASRSQDRRRLRAEADGGENASPAKPNHQTSDQTSEQSGAQAHLESSDGGRGAIATRSRPALPRVDRLPPWKVVLHNDDDSDMLFVVDTIVVLGVTDRQDAIQRMLEAHKTGSSLLITTHRERAELLQEQFTSKGMTVTIEPE